MKPEKPVATDGPDSDRRKFLEACGKFAVVTPPAVTMLLSTSLTSPAVANSSGAGGNTGDGENGRSDDGRDRPWWWWLLQWL